MMILCNSGERSLGEYVQLAAKANLQLVKAWDLGEMFAIEFAPARLE